MYEEFTQGEGGWRPGQACIKEFTLTKRGNSHYFTHNLEIV